MQLQLTPFDYFIFFGTLIRAMLPGFFDDRKEDTCEDYVLVGKSIRWFGVTDSIFL